MDIFDYMMSFGNMDVLAFWNLKLGWVYPCIKIMMYLLVVGCIVYKIWQMKKYNIGVVIQVVSAEKTIYEYHDKAMFCKDGGHIKLLKRRIELAVPNRKNILPVFGKLFIKHKIMLYQFGETVHSYTPIEVGLTIDNKMKFKPIDPKLSMLESLNKQSRVKFGEKKAFFVQNGTILLSMGFILICFVMLLIVVEKVPSLISESQSALMVVNKQIAENNKVSENLIKACYDIKEVNSQNQNNNIDKPPY